MPYQFSAHATHTWFDLPVKPLTSLIHEQLACICASAKLNAPMGPTYQNICSSSFELHLFPLRSLLLLVTHYYLFIAPVLAKGDGKREKRECWRRRERGGLLKAGSDHGCNNDGALYMWARHSIHLYTPLHSPYILYVHSAFRTMLVSYIWPLSIVFCCLSRSLFVNQIPFNASAIRALAPRSLISATPQTSLVLISLSIIKRNAKYVTCHNRAAA